MFSQESYWSEKLQFEPKLFPSPVLFGDILCNIKLRSDKGHVSNVLASENHKLTITLCLFTYCFIKSVSLWKSIWGTCETENNIWAQLWIVNGSSLCSVWNQLWFPFSTLVECIHWEYFTLFYVIAICKNYTNSPISCNYLNAKHCSVEFP